MILILMGVSGSGKSTIGHMLADKLHWTFEDGDDFHPPSNKTKMSSGVPLNDTDRYEWLLNLNNVIQRWHRSMQNAIIVCSALKIKYRQVLIAGHSAKYLDTDVSLSSACQEGCSQEMKTDSEMQGLGPEMEQPHPCIKKKQDHLPHQTPSSMASIQVAAPTLSGQQEKHHHSADNNHHSCPTGHQPPKVLFIHLKGTMDLISSRLSQRKEHFFNPRLLQSQFDTLEELGEDEDGFVVDISNTSDSIVSQIVAHALSLLSEPN